MIGIHRSDLDWLALADVPEPRHAGKRRVVDQVVLGKGRGGVARLANLGLGIREPRRDEVVARGLGGRVERRLERHPSMQDPEQGRAAEG